jgi:hypothetical protein
MHLKFKIYYWCILYALIWTISLLVIVIFSVFKQGFKDDVLFTFLLLIVLLLPVLKCILSLRFFNHFKKGSIYTNKERVFFFILYSVNVLATTLGCIACFAEISNAGTEYTTYYTVRIFDASLIIATACGIYFIFMDIILLRAICKKYHQDIDSIGINISTQS